MGAPELAEIEAWSDEDYRRATGLVSLLARSTAERQGRSRGAPGVRAGGAARRLPGDAARAGARRGGARAGARPGASAPTPRRAGPRRPSSARSRRSRPTTSWRPARRDAGAALARGYPVRGARRAALRQRARYRRAGGGSPAARRCRARSTSCRPRRTPARSSRMRPASPGRPRCRRSRPSRSRYFEAIDVDAEDFHAGLNFAAVFRLPVIFVCVNDGKRAPLDDLRDDRRARRSPTASPACASTAATSWRSRRAVRAAAERARTRRRRDADRGGGGGGGRRIARSSAGGWLAARRCWTPRAEAAMRERGRGRDSGGGRGRGGGRAAADARHHRERPGPNRPAALEEQLDELERVRDKTVRP